MSWGLQLPVLFSNSFLGNRVESYVIAALTFLAAVVALRIFRTVASTRLVPLAARASREVEELLQGMLRHIGPLVYVALPLELATEGLKLPAATRQNLHLLVFVVLTVKLLQVGQDLLLFAVRRWVGRGESPDAAAITVTRNVSLIVKFGLWGLGGLFLADNLGFNVSSVVTGLGIGGVAVALASQAILKDAFSAFAIWMDKPFEVGDAIALGDLHGTVEYVGFKTTRLRSLGGEQIVVSNSDLTDGRIRNFRRMTERRVVFRFGVVYRTPVETLREIPQIVQRIVEAQSGLRFDRAHLAALGESSLDFEVAYYVRTRDYDPHMDAQHEIYLQLLDGLAQRQIEFAYPTRQVYVTPIPPPDAV